MAPKCNVDAAIELGNDDVCRGLALLKVGRQGTVFTPLYFLFEL